MYLTLDFRNEDGSRDGGPEVIVKIGFVWFEGPDDLHIQFDTPGSCNFCPPVCKKSGDYLAPHPETGKMKPLYSFRIQDKLDRGNRVTRGYREKLEKHWPSPNR